MVLARRTLAFRTTIIFDPIGYSVFGTSCLFIGTKCVYSSAGNYKHDSENNFKQHTNYNSYAEYLFKYVSYNNKEMDVYDLYFNKQKNNRDKEKLH